MTIWVPNLSFPGTKERRTPKRFYDEVDDFVKAALRHITKDGQIQTDLLEITKLSLQRSKRAAEKELSKLYQDEKQQPIT